MGIGRSAILPYAKLPALGKGIVSPSGSRGWTPQKLITELQKDIAIWNNIDGLWVFARKSETESYLVELKGSGRNGVAAGGTVTFDNEYGVYSDGLGYINLNHRPVTHKTSYEKDGSSFMIYIVDDFLQNAAIIGCHNGTDVIGISPKLINGPGKNIFLNQAAVNSINVQRTSGLILINRIGATVELFKDGVSMGTYSRASTNIPDLNLYSLTQNPNGATPTTANAAINRLAMTMIAGDWTVDQALAVSSIFNQYFESIGTTKKLYKRSHSLVDYSRPQYVLVAQHGDYKLARTYQKLLFSSNNGSTWTEYTFTDADKITDGYIWDNGNINFATYNKVYFSNNGLASATELICKESDGVTNYTLHTPASATFPGTYYRVESSKSRKHYIGGAETRVVGNYGNSLFGANPTNIYQYLNDGALIKVIYKFGQNPYYRDNGTANPGATGTLLGDATNPIFCRHIHSLAQVPNTGRFIFCTGDHVKVEQNEVMWWQIELSGGTWTATKIYEGATLNRMKALGINIVDGYVYFASDDTDKTELGVWKCIESDIPNLANQTKIYNANELMYDLFVDDDAVKIVGTKVWTAAEKNVLIISNNSGASFESINLDLPGKATFAKIMLKDADGFNAMETFTINGKQAFNLFNPTPLFKVK